MVTYWDMVIGKWSLEVIGKPSPENHHPKTVTGNRHQKTVTGKPSLENRHPKTVIGKCAEWSGEGRGEHLSKVASLAQTDTASSFLVAASIGSPKSDLQRLLRGCGSCTPETMSTLDVTPPPFLVVVVFSLSNKNNYEQLIMLKRSMTPPSSNIVDIGNRRLQTTP